MYKALDAERIKNERAYELLDVESQNEYAALLRS